MQRRPGANLDALRDHNGALVLDLVRAQQGLSRVDLAARTGLTAQAVSKIVARLIDDGLVAESGQAVPTVGKPRTLLRLVDDARYSVGVHLDRDELRLVLVDLAGTVVDSRHVSEQVTTVEQIAHEVTALLQTVPPDKVIGIGVGCPGPLDHRTGVVLGATRLDAWRNVPLRDLLADATGLPVIVDKDTNAAVLAERWQSGADHYALIYIGTGIGAGLVLGGEVHRGANTNAGEFGHTPLQIDGPLCACGRRGCVEAVCGPAAVVARVIGPVPEAEVLTQFARLHDTEEVRTAARQLATAVTGLVNLLDLDHVVLGGRAAQAYVAEVERAVGVTLTVSGLGPHLVAAGAATLPLAASHPSRAALAARQR